MTSSPHAEAKQIHTTTQRMPNDSKSSCRGTTDPYNYTMHAKRQQILIQRHDRSIQLCNARQMSSSLHAEAQQIHTTTQCMPNDSKSSCRGKTELRLPSHEQATGWSKRNICLGHIHRQWSNALCCVCNYISDTFVWDHRQRSNVLCISFNGNEAMLCDVFASPCFLAAASASWFSHKFRFDVFPANVT